jgi:hypothetical protein
MTVCFSVCGLLPPVLRTLCGLLGGPMRGSGGGLNAEALPPWHRRLHSLRRRQRARRPQCARPQGVVQQRRECRQVFLGFGARHRNRWAPDIQGGRRFLIGEDTRSLPPDGWQCPLGATARVTPARADLAPCCICVLLGGSGAIPADGQQRVAWGLGQAGQGFPRTLVSDVSSHREAPSIIFCAEPTSSFIAEQLLWGSAHLGARVRQISPRLA